MGRPLEPDVKAQRAIVRALEPLDRGARLRVLEYVAAGECETGSLAELAARNARLSECLRWVSAVGYVGQEDKARVAQALNGAGS